MTKLLKICCLTLMQTTAGLMCAAHAQEDSAKEGHSKDAMTGSNHIDESTYVKPISSRSTTWCSRNPVRR